MLPGGAPLFHQGEPADAVYLVTSGCLGVFRHDDEDAVEGGPALIAEITPGNIVGEMSLLSHGKRTRSVAALRDSEVWRLAAGELRQSHGASSRGAAGADAQHRGAQCHGAGQAPPPAAHLRAAAGRSRRAVVALRGPARARAGADRRRGADARLRIRWTRIPSGSRAASSTIPSCSIAPIPRSRRGPSFACARPTAWSCCTTPILTSRPGCRSRSRRRSPARCSIAAASWCCCTKATIRGPARPPASSPAGCTASITMCGSTCRRTSIAWRG